MESFDTYAQRYESFNLSRVLLKLAQASKEQLSDAYSFCISHAKQHGHHILYKNLIDQANKKGLSLSSIADYDSDWVQKKEQEFRQEFSKKESELKLHIANNIKPSIQMSYLDLARLYIKAGDFNEFEQYATKSYEVQSQNTEANYYFKICLLLKQRIDDVKRIAENEIEQENYKNMASEMRTAYLHGRVILAITKMKTKDYFSAFNILSNITPEYLPDIGIYTSFYDLSRYLAVLGVICYKREDIIEKFHAETTKQLFHYNQNAVKLINGFVHANYEEATRALEKVMEELHEDSFLASSAESLRSIILEKILKQYLSTVSEVPIKTVSEVFRLSEGECKTLLKNLILAQKIPFKIDSLRNVLVFQKKDEISQSKLVKKALGTIGNYSLEKQFAILKVHYQAVSGMGKGRNKSAFDFLE